MSIIRVWCGSATRDCFTYSTLSHIGLFLGRGSDTAHISEGHSPNQSPSGCEKPKLCSLSIVSLLVPFRIVLTRKHLFFIAFPIALNFIFCFEKNHFSWETELLNSKREERKSNHVFSASHFAPFTGRSCFIYALDVIAAVNTGYLRRLS